MMDANQIIEMQARRDDDEAQGQMRKDAASAPILRAELFASRSNMASMTERCAIAEEVSACLALQLDSAQRELQELRAQRCKTCSYYEGHGAQTVYCNKLAYADGHGLLMKPEEYCSWWQTKEE